MGLDAPGRAERAQVIETERGAVGDRVTLVDGEVDVVDRPPKIETGVALVGVRLPE